VLFKSTFKTSIKFNYKKYGCKNTSVENNEKRRITLMLKKIVELTNLDRKVVDKAMTDLKEEGLIISLKRCYWQAK